uniref:26S proteasome complex subunit SEM1 n=1 Tax=Felis catus TaxID=9685 RepID=A0ABI7WCE1_FELCA
PLGRADGDSGLRVESARRARRALGLGLEAPTGSLDPCGRLCRSCARTALRESCFGIGVSRWASPVSVTDWAGLDEDEDAHVWEDNWDDDNVEDDFSNQLRAELEKHGYKMETS